MLSYHGSYHSLSEDDLEARFVCCLNGVECAARFPAQECQDEIGSEVNHFLVAAGSCGLAILGPVGGMAFLSNLREEAAPAVSVGIRTRWAVTMDNGKGIKAVRQGD